MGTKRNLRICATIGLLVTRRTIKSFFVFFLLLSTTQAFGYFGMQFVLSDDMLYEDFSTHHCQVDFQTADGYEGPTGTAPGANVDASCIYMDWENQVEKTFILEVIITDIFGNIVCGPGGYAAEFIDEEAEATATGSWVTLHAGCDASQIDDAGLYYVISIIHEKEAGDPSLKFIYGLKSPFVYF